MKTIYKANDGKEFDNENDCLNYENKLNNEELNNLIDALCSERKNIKDQLEEEETNRIRETIKNMQPKISIFENALENFKKLKYSSIFAYTSGLISIRVEINYKSSGYCQGLLKCTGSDLTSITYLHENDYWYNRPCNRHQILAIGKVLDEVPLESIQYWYNKEINMAIKLYNEENNQLKSELRKQG